MAARGHYYGGSETDPPQLMSAQSSNQGGQPMPKGAKPYRGNDPKLRKQGWYMPRQPKSPEVPQADSAPVTSEPEISSEPVSPVNSAPSAPIDNTPWWRQPGSKATPQQIQSLDSTAAYNASPEGIAKQQEIDAKSAKKNPFGKFNDE